MQSESGTEAEPDGSWTIDGAHLKPHLPSSYPPPMTSFLIFIAICGFLLWLLTLISHIRRDDLSDSDRIVWTIILCTLNILGMVLYWFLAPAGKYHAKSEAELKEYFNSRSR